MFRASSIIAVLFFSTAALGANPGSNRILSVTEGGTGTPNGPAAVPFTANGGASSATPAARAGHTLNVIDDFGAKGGGQKSDFAVTCASGSKSVMFSRVNGEAQPAFSSADIGKVIDLPGCGNTYTLKRIQVTAAGSGYNVGDVLTVPGGTGAAATLIVVSTKQGGNGVDELGIQSVGSYSDIPTGTLTATSSTGGSGAQFTLTFQNILATTIQSVSAYDTLTVAANAGASQSAATQNVTWGWDDTAALQNALNSCRYIQLANDSFLVQKIVFPTCGSSATGISKGGLIGNAQSSLIAIVGADNGFLAATKNWAENTAWADAPYFVSNVTFDANSIAIDAVDDMSFQSRFTLVNFVNALRFGHNTAGYTRNFTAIGNGIGQQVFTDASASYNGLDGFHNDPPWTMANGVASRGGTDTRFVGGGAFLNGGYGRHYNQNAGVAMQGVHDWANRPATGVPGDGTYGYDVRLDNYGFGTALTGNVFEGGAEIVGIGTSKVGVFGPGNQLGGNLQTDGRDNQQGATLTSLGNNFYACSAGLYIGYNGTNPILISSGDSFQCANFSGNAYGWQMWAKDVTVYYGAQHGQTYRCTINGFIRPNHGAGYPCTDFEIPKTAGAGATSLTFTITATGQQIDWQPGAGFHMLGQLEVSSYSGGSMETYRADVTADFAYASGTTNVAHKAAISNVQDSAGSPTVSASIVCSDTTHTATDPYVETCVVTVNFPAAANENMTNVRFKAHFDQNQITALTVQ